MFTITALRVACMMYQSCNRGIYFFFSYACLLYEEKELAKLDKLATELFYTTEIHPATWVALGYRALGKHDYKRAIYLAVQATKLNQLCKSVRTVESMCLGRVTILVYRRLLC